MSINPLAPVETYPQMLTKIATLDFFFTIFLSIELTNRVLPHGWAREMYNQTSPVLNIQVPLVLFGPAALVAFLSRAFAPHNLISNLFHIRQRFDKYRILLPLALGAGVTLSPRQLATLEAHQSELMEKVFYPFARTNDEEGTISKHYVTLAMDAWSWYWISLEFVALLCFASILAALFENFAFAFWALALALILMWLMLPLYERCSKRALDEIEQILSDPARKTRVEAEFSGL